MNIQNIETLLTNTIAFGVTEHGLDACVKARDALAKELGVSHEQQIVGDFAESMTDLLATAKSEGFNKLETLYAIQDLINYRLGFFKYMGFTVPSQFSVQPSAETETVEASEPNQPQSKPEEAKMKVQKFIKDVVAGAKFVTEIQASNINSLESTKDFARAYMAIRAVDGVLRGNTLEKVVGAAQLVLLASNPKVGQEHLAANIGVTSLAFLRNGFWEDAKLSMTHTGIAATYAFIRNVQPRP